MKYSIERTTQFKKDYKLAKKQGLDTNALKEIIDKLSKGEKLPEKHKDHGLKGDYEGYRECHIVSDWLLIYKMYEDVLVLSLVRTGTHSRLFR